MRRRLTEAEFEELLSIVDRHAGKVHGREGRVAASLREVLARHVVMLSTPPSGYRPLAVPERRLRECVEAWPGCYTMGYDPRCCRFPKSCSCTVYDPELVTDDDLEGAE